MSLTQIIKFLLLRINNMKIIFVSVALKYEFIETISQFCINPQLH